MKVSNVTTEPRIKVKLDKTKGVQSYDIDNNYPARVANIISHSGTASSCIELFAKFIVGNGFKDKKFWKSKINDSGTTVDKLLKSVANDYAKFKGFAIHISYNILLQKTEFTHVPFEFCRKGELDDELYAGKIIVYNNWDKSINEKINKVKFQIYDTYNSNKEVISYQIGQAGGIDKYKGQIYYHTGDNSIYPKSPLDSVLEDCQTDAEIKAFRLRNATSNFMASHMVEYPYSFESDSEREQEISRWENMQGARKACKFNIVENPELGKGGVALKVTKFDNQDNDQIFEVTNRTTKDSIIEAMGQPPILLGVAVAGKLGTANEVKDAFKFYNSYTANDRRIIEEAFIELFTGLDLNESKDYTIEKLVFEEDNGTLLERIGDAGVNTMLNVINSGLPYDQKINTLMLVFGLTTEEATSVVPPKLVEARL